jgi:hypothetical protein
VDPLQLVRGRAEKWIGGIGALTGVLAKTPHSSSKAQTTPPRDARLANRHRHRDRAARVATYRAYQAAFGQPDILREIKTIPLTGLHNRLTQARRDAADDALRDLGAAVRAVFAAIALIAAAVAITWFAPTDTTAKPAGSVCIYARGQLVARLSASIIAVKDIAAGTTIKPCP